MNGIKTPALAIVGSKQYLHQDWVEFLIGHLPPGTQLVTTAQPGPCAWAFELAQMRQLPRPKICAIPRGELSKEEFIKYALDQRERILRQATILVCFWNGADIGIKETVDMAAQAGIPTYIIADGFSERQAGWVLRQALQTIALDVNQLEAGPTQYQAAGATEPNS